MQLKALREAKLHSFEKHLEYKRQFSSTTTTGLAIVRSDDKQRFREYLDGLRIYIQRDEATTSMLLIDLDYSVFRAAFLNKNLCQLLMLYPNKKLISAYIMQFEKECNNVLRARDLENDTRELYLGYFDKASNFYHKLNSPQIAQETATGSPSELIAAAASPAKPKSPPQIAQQASPIIKEKTEYQKFLAKLPGKSELEKVNLIGLYRSKRKLSEDELQELTSIRKTVFEQILDSSLDDAEIIKYAEKLTYLTDLNREEKRFLELRFQDTRESLRFKGKYDLSSRYHTLLALLK